MATEKGPRGYHLVVIVKADNAKINSVADLTFRIPGTSVGRGFKHASRFVPIDYKNDWQAVVGILEANGASFSRESPEYRKSPSRRGRVGSSLPRPVPEIAELRKRDPTGDEALAGVSLTVGSRDAVFVNIRESPVPGIVGAGGIGFVLNEAIPGLEWARVGVILVVILGVVALSELSSAWIRGRLT